MSVETRWIPGNKIGITLFYCPKWFLCPQWQTMCCYGSFPFVPPPPPSLVGEYYLHSRWGTNVPFAPRTGGHKRKRSVVIYHSTVQKFSTCDRTHGPYRIFLEQQKKTSKPNIFKLLFPVKDALSIGSDEENLTLPSSFQRFKIRSDNFSLKFVFVTVYPLYSYCCIIFWLYEYLVILVFFNIELDHRSNKTWSLYVQQINPIWKQIEEKDICLRHVQGETTSCYS